MISHANVLTFLTWCSEMFAPTPDDRFSSHAPFPFDASVFDIYAAIKHGASLHLISDAIGKSPEELARFIETRRLTIWLSAPSPLVLLTQFGNLQSHGRSSFRFVLFGGEVLAVKHLRELQRHWPSPIFYNVYGPTETCVFCTVFQIPAVVPADRELPYPIGFPGPHCQVLVLNDRGEPTSGDEEGFLHIAGGPVFLGYWNRPIETEAAFIVRDGVRWYNTGDLVRQDPADGLIFVGRKDGMIKRRGYRIELGEIEHALYLHPRVREAAVVSVPDAGQGGRIVAFVSCDGSDAPSIIEFKTFCASRLPLYMIPDQFVFRRELPRTSTDKVDYQVLRRELSEARAG
jgi:acyl-coenzyme A synthetase/AMP-(fatty) acid ligase